MAGRSLSFHPRAAGEADRVSATDIADGGAALVADQPDDLCRHGAARLRARGAAMGCFCRVVSLFLQLAGADCLRDCARRGQSHPRAWSRLYRDAFRCPRADNGGQPADHDAGALHRHDGGMAADIAQAADDDRLCGRRRGADGGVDLHVAVELCARRALAQRDVRAGDDKLDCQPCDQPQPVHAL